MQLTPDAYQREKAERAEALADFQAHAARDLADDRLSPAHRRMLRVLLALAPELAQRGPLAPPDPP